MQSANRIDASLFSKDDHECLHEAMKVLNEKEIAILVLRFWGMSTIKDIARHLGVRWSTVDRVLNEALNKLRLTLLSDPNFIRTFTAWAA